MLCMLAATLLGARGTNKRCEACLHMVNGLHETPLFWRLEEEEAARAKDAQSAKLYKSTLRHGAIDELIEEAVLNRACAALLTGAAVRSKAACDQLVEDHGDTFIEVVAQWYKARQERSELRELLCVRGARSCRTSELGLVPPRDTATLAPDQKSYLSERPPTLNEGPVYQMVGSTINETMAKAMDHDLFVLYHRHGDVADDRWERLTAMYERLALLMHELPRRPHTYLFAKINARANEMPPPFHRYSEASAQSTIAVYPKGTHCTLDAIELNFHVLEWLEPSGSSSRMARPLSKVLSHMQSVPGLSDKTRQHVGNLLVHLGDERLVRDLWETDAEILARVSAGYDDEVEAETRKKKQAKAEALQEKRRRKKQEL